MIERLVDVRDATEHRQHAYEQVVEADPRAGIQAADLLQGLDVVDPAPARGVNDVRFASL